MFGFSIYARLIVVAILALGLSMTHWKAYTNGKAAIQAAWDADKAQAVIKAREKEQVLQSNADKIREEKNREIRQLNDRVAVLTDSLRKRPERPKVSETSGAGPRACTGAELYREDGEFLIRLAREADEIRLAYRQCLDQYQSLQ